MRISDWSSDVCSSDLTHRGRLARRRRSARPRQLLDRRRPRAELINDNRTEQRISLERGRMKLENPHLDHFPSLVAMFFDRAARGGEDPFLWRKADRAWHRSEEHTSELQSLMRISYAVFCLTTKNNICHTT